MFAVSILLQFAAAAVCVHLAVKSGWYAPWLLITAAVTLMGVRRIVSFVAAIRLETVPARSLGPELIALVISALMLTGLIFFSPAFAKLEHVRRKELYDKDLMIRESHHTVKNNLELLRSIVVLRQNATDNENERRLLQELNLRIHAFSLLHQHLYNSETVTPSLRNYLERLCAAVQDAYKSPLVHFQYTIEEYAIDSRAMLYSGLIINEALTNAFKHAFHDCTNPTITIVARRSDDRMVMRVHDNGPGLPNDVLHGPRRSYGFSLIHTIGSSEGWETAVHSNHGTTVEFSFPAAS